MSSAAVLAQGIDERVNEAFTPVSDAVQEVIFFAVPVGGTDLPLIVLWLITAGVFFTIYLKGFQFTAWRQALQLVRGRFNDPRDAGEVTHFQALATAVSGTVGLGNIAGVAVAITLGGPGATLWMIVAGLLGMCTKGVECTLGVKHRREFPDGHVSGGPMYYLSRGLAEQGRGGLGKVLAVLFCLFTVGGALGGGNMFQSNQAYTQLRNVTGGADSPLEGFGWLFGLGMAVLVGVVIIGGIRNIARVTDKLVPFMAVLYITACLVVIIANAGAVPAALGAILTGAFTAQAGVGGLVGALIVGFQRAAFSNEAGVGSAAIAHSAVKTKHPASEGHVATLEPFIDTVVICTMTALAIVITGVYDTEDASDGVALTSDAFATVLPWFPLVLALAVFLFAYSTMLAWSYYGLKAVTYLLGESMLVDRGYKLVFCLFVVIGASASLDPIIGFSDSMIFAMSLPNIIGLYLMARVVKGEIGGYHRALASGEIAPVEQRV